MDGLEASRPLAPGHGIRHPRSPGPQAPGVRGLDRRQDVSRRGDVCRGDHRLSPSARARSDAAPGRRAPGCRGPAATRRELAAARQRSILRRGFGTSRVPRAYEFMPAWGILRAPAIPGALRRPKGVAGSPFYRGDTRWTTRRVEDHGGSATMAKRSRQTFQKHQKEQARQQKQKNKAARRLQAKQRRADAASAMGEPPGEIANRRPGPQPAPVLGDHVSELA